MSEPSRRHKPDVSMHEQIKTVLANVLGVPPSAIPDDASVDNVENWDSLRQIRLLMALEEMFIVSFSDEEIMSLTSLAAIEQAIEQRRGNSESLETAG